MSWETLVTGSVSFKTSVPEPLKLKIIGELEEVLETELEWDAKWQEYRFQSVNWTSHVSEDGIREICKRWEPFFKEFSVSLYYLNEADYSEYANNEDQDAETIALSLLDDLAEALEEGDTVKANVRLETIVELLKAVDVNSGAIAEKISRLSDAVEGAYGLEKEYLRELVGILDELGFATEKLKRALLVVSV